MTSPVAADSEPPAGTVVRPHAATDAKPRASLSRVWTPAFAVAVAALILLVGIVGLFGSPYTLTLGSQVAIFAIIILGLNLLVGYGGQISFGHNAFFGIGGYISALATTSWGMSPVSGMLTAAFITIVVAAVIGYPTLRLKGHFLALGTFAVGLGFYAFAVASPYFNGFTGIGGIPPLSLGSLTISQQFAQFWACGTFLVLALIVVAQLREGRWGRALRTVATDEATAASVGINVHRTKLTAFVISAIFGSIAGSLYAHTTNYVSPETFSFPTILTLFMMLFIGGVSSVWGAVLGSFIVTVIPELLPSTWATWQPTLFGVALVILLIIRPSGLLARRSRKSRRDRRAGTQPVTDGEVSG